MNPFLALSDLNRPFKGIQMTIKPQNLLRSLLLIPYLAWGIALLFVSIVYELAGNSEATNAFLDVLTGIASIYTIGIVFWGIPYTILTVGLVLWGIHKPAPTIYRVFLFSPFLLSVLTLIEVALISFWPPQAPSLEALMEFLSSTLIIVIPTLIFGYVFVGLGSIIYKTMRRLNLVRTEGEAQ